MPTCSWFPTPATWLLFPDSNMARDGEHSGAVWNRVNSTPRAARESITGVSTSSLTLFDDPSVLDRGELIWRSGTQWLGGLGALALGVGLLPFLGGSPELADPRQRGSRRLSLAPRPVPALKRVAVLYLIVSGVVIVSLFVVGMSFTDAVARHLLPKRRRTKGIRDAMVLDRLDDVGRIHLRRMGRIHIGNDTGRPQRRGEERKQGERWKVDVVGADAPFA